MVLFLIKSYFSLLLFYVFCATYEVSFVFLVTTCQNEKKKTKSDVVSCAEKNGTKIGKENIHPSSNAYQVLGCEGNSLRLRLH